jgi:hypothetical protein
MEPLLQQGKVCLSRWSSDVLVGLTSVRTANSDTDIVLRLQIFPLREKRVQLRRYL